MQINSNYILIDNKKSFELSLINLLNSDSISVDTESSGFYTYFSQVCLIQITCNGKNYIFDPLSNIDISALGEIFASSKILKIFHSAIDDVKVLKRDFQFNFSNVADTMYSSKLLGMDHNSLEYLVDFFHQVKLSKTQQKSNWEQRPLKEIQLKYAALDTAYLESIWSSMKSELIRLGLYEEAISEFERIIQETASKKDETQPVAWYKFPDINRYTPEDRRIIVEILNYREDKARRINRAPFRVISKELIEKLVKEKPDTETLLNLLGKKDSESIYEIIHNQTGEPIHDVTNPKSNLELNESEELLLSRLKKWREKVMNHRQIDHSMLLSNKQLVAILQSDPKNLEDLENLNLMSTWKVKNYGLSLLKALNNEPYEDLIKKLVQVKKSKSKKKKFIPKNQGDKNKNNVT